MTSVTLWKAREAAELLKITQRQVFRLLQRYQAGGDAGLASLSNPSLSTAVTRYCQTLLKKEEVA